MKIKKIFLIPYSTLDELSNDTSLNSLRWIYRAAKIHGTKKKPIWVYSSPPLKRVGTKMLNCYSNRSPDLILILQNFAIITTACKTLIYQTMQLFQLRRFTWANEQHCPNTTSSTNQKRSILCNRLMPKRGRARDHFGYMQHGIHVRPETLLPNSAKRDALQRNQIFVA